MIKLNDQATVMIKLNVHSKGIIKLNVQLYHACSIKPVA